MTLITQVHQKSAYFVIIGKLKMLDLNLNQNVCTKYRDVLMTAYELKNIAILNVKGVDYSCILWGNSKNKGVNIK